MGVEAKGYTVYSLKTGQIVAYISPEGVVQDNGDSEAIAKLRALMQHELVVREHQLGVDAEENEEYDPYPEENMCYFGVITLRPDDPAYFDAFIRRLPYISFYEARPVEE